MVRLPDARMTAGKDFGQYMAVEISEAPAVFARAAGADHRAALAGLMLGDARAFYSIARGSSDAAANIGSYEMMRDPVILATSVALGHDPNRPARLSKVTQTT